jgi:hypothetical protein
MLGWRGCDWSFDLRRWVSQQLRLRFGNRSTFEEVISQRSFDIGNELAHGLRLRYTKSSRGGVPDGLKFGGSSVCGSRRSGRTFDCHIGFVPDCAREKSLAQRRLEVRERPEFL